MPLMRRVPKRGFKNYSKRLVAALNLDRLNRFDGKTPVSPDKLKASGLVRKSADIVKILGQGELSKPLTIQAHQFSRKAIEKIKKKGGKAEVIQTPVRNKTTSVEAK